MGDPAKAQQLKTFKGLFGNIRLYTAFSLLFVIITHIIAVLITDARASGSIISALFTGKPLDDAS